MSLLNVLEKNATNITGLAAGYEAAQIYMNEGEQNITGSAFFNGESNGKGNGQMILNGRMQQIAGEIYAGLTGNNR